jgi:peptidoglycan/xylan/chitin deacetylase (PgdA/CDA1 family)
MVKFFESIDKLLVITLAFVLSACTGTVRANVEPLDFKYETTTVIAPKESPTPFSTWITTPTAPPNERQYITSYTPFVTNTPIHQVTASPTKYSVPSETPEPTETPEPIYIPAGSAVAPILLYHIISDQGDGNRYFVTVDDFCEQMRTLHDLGYSAITPSQLASVLINGGELPARPVVITFDDGNQTVYTHAYPIMREMGFIGAIYMYVDRLNFPLYLNIEQLQEMVAQGWEIGSHSLSHTDLTGHHASVPYELQQSRTVLENAIGMPEVTFAYPYGKADDYITGLIDDYGYIAGMGVGARWEHTLDTITFLNRTEIQSDFDINKFISLLPWTDK